MDFCSTWVEQPSKMVLRWVHVPGDCMHEARCCQERGKPLVGQGPLATSGWAPVLPETPPQWGHATARGSQAAASPSSISQLLP